MRFANINCSFKSLLNPRKLSRSAVTFAVVLLGFHLGKMPAQAETVWRIAGQQVLALGESDPSANDRIAQWHQRLIDIAAKLDPNQPWVVDILPPPSSPTNTQFGKPVLIRLQGQPFLEVTDLDARTYNAKSVLDLANTWARSLSALLAQPGVRQTLTAVANLPPQLSYSGTTYYQQPEIALDRGLFRTNGQRASGRVVFWEVPSDSRSSRMDSTNPLQLAATNPNPPAIFILSRNLQFIPYMRQGRSR